MGDTAVAAAPVADIVHGEKRERAHSDMGELLNSPSAALMTLVDCDHLNDFNAVCEYLAVHAQEVRSKHFFAAFIFILNRRQRKTTFAPY